MTYNVKTGDSGILLDDVWGDTVLDCFKPALDGSITHCPMIGAQEGFNRDLSLKPGMLDLLHDSQPLFFPNGELMSEKVTGAGTSSLRTFYLPEVCNLPLGMRWPVDIGWEDCFSSIQGAMGPAGQIFQHVLTGLNKKSYNPGFNRFHSMLISS